VSAVQPFTTTRVYDAPRERVWQAWTEAERLNQWFAPRGFQTVRNKMDLRPGGLYHYCLRMPDGSEMWGKWVFREIVKPEKLVFIVSFSDAKGGTTRHPMNPHWPHQMHSTVTFEAQGSKTKVSVSWLPLDATDTENQAFEEGRDSMKQGWGGTLDALLEYLGKAKP
jgi:uncharacterized protein YndB with AHSA1/START domain